MGNIQKLQRNEFELHRTGDYFVFPLDHYQTPPPLYADMVGMDSCLEGYRIARKASEVCVFAYIMNGQGEVRIDGHTLNVNQGNVMILPRGLDHEYYPAKGEIWTFLWINVYGGLIDVLLKDYGLDNRYRFDGGNTEHLFRRALQVADASRGSSQDLQRQLILTVMEIILEIQAHDQLQEHAVSIEVSKVKRYLDESIEKKISLSKLGELANMTARQLFRKFKKELGTTPYEYYMQRKIEIAKNLLDHSQFSVKEIALRLGFNDAYHFSGMFKKKTGTSPTAYKQKS